jgi:hypothetical protein
LRKKYDFTFVKCLVSSELEARTSNMMEERRKGREFFFIPIWKEKAPRS